MIKTEFWQFSEYFAQKCDVCKGQKYVRKGTTTIKCLCQQRATLEYRYSQIPVFPEDLKYKEWSDFTGEIKEGLATGRKETIGMLAGCGVEAKMRALSYCFKTGKPDAYKDRKSNLIVLDHLKTGRNVIIAGGRNTGKTLMAALINREIALASFYFHRNIDFKWVRSSQVLEAASWDNSKDKDSTFIDSIKEVDFLTIDGVDLPTGGHTTPPDRTAMNSLFGTRIYLFKPTIVIMTDTFYQTVTHDTAFKNAVRLWGEEFVGMVNMPENVIIKLEKE